MPLNYMRLIFIVDFMLNFYILGRITLVLHHVDGLTIPLLRNNALELGVVKPDFLLKDNRLNGFGPLQSVSNRVFVAIILRWLC